MSAPKDTKTGLATKDTKITKTTKNILWFVFFVTFVVNAVSVSFAAQAPELIAEILVHGNHTTPEADVLALAGLAVGEPATPARLAEAEATLRGSGRFEAIEVRRRSRSIADPTEVLVILLVDERAGVSTDNLIPGPLSRLGYAAMWLPVLHHRDGYGLTYGARASFVNPLGATSRISTPFTWGGERRAALEVERSFEGRWIPSLRAAASISRRVNPHFEEPDTRSELSVQAERAVTPWLRAGARAGLARVAFAGRDARRSVGGLHLVADTRVDPSFPRNAVQAEVAWERLGFSGEDLAGPLARNPPHVRRPGAAERTRRAAVGRWSSDVRGFLGIGGSAVLALRGQAVYAGSPLPDFEQALLGGADSVRGYRTGHRAGDRVAAFSAEVRLPLTSPLSAGRVGIKAFVDAGTAWAADARLADQRFDRGIGGGVYVGATAVTANLDVAWPERGKPRVHVGLGLSF